MSYKPQKQRKKELSNPSKKPGGGGLKLRPCDSVHPHKGPPWEGSLAALSKRSERHWLGGNRSQWGPVVLPFTLFTSTEQTWSGGVSIITQVRRTAVPVAVHQNTWSWIPATIHCLWKRKMNPTHLSSASVKWDNYCVFETFQLCVCYVGSMA